MARQKARKQPKRKGARGLAPARDVVRERVAARYGGHPASALSVRGSGWLLRTRGGEIYFYPTYIRLADATQAERARAAKAKVLRERAAGLILPSDSNLGDELVKARIATGILFPPKRRRSALATEP